MQQHKVALNSFGIYTATTIIQNSILTGNLLRREKRPGACFPSQWQRNGDVYFARKWTANNKEYHFRNEQAVQRLADMDKWSIPSRCDTTDFDFTWHPDSVEEPYEYRFPTQHQREGGPVYKGTAGIKYCNSQKRSN